MTLLTQHEMQGGRLCRSLRLLGSDDGRTVILVEYDERKPGIQRGHRFEITTGELIALIRTHHEALLREEPPRLPMAGAA